MSQKWNSEHIHFTRKARRGLFVLLFLFIIIAVVPRIYNNYFSDTRVDTIQISNIQNELKTNEEIHKESTYQIPSQQFNPNNYTIKQWEAIGLTKKQALSAVHYIQAGGKLKIKSDVKKLYGITPELYALIASKIDLPESLSNERKVNKGKQLQQDYSKNNNNWKAFDITNEVPIQPIQINKASQKQLLEIKGIGPYFAKKILELREKFGGFISLQQLTLIYKMDSLKLAEIAPYLIIDKDHVKKLNVNIASMEQLQKHPWITHEMAKSIVYFRNNYKKYTKLDQLLLSPYIDAKTLKKLGPYLSLK